MNTKNHFNTSVSRYAIVCAMAMLPLQASAQVFDFTPDATRIVSDPAYLPMKGQIFGSTEYYYDRQTSNSDNYLGAPHSSNTFTSNTIAQVLEYGVTDDISLRVSDNYSWYHSATDYTTGTSSDSDSNGFADPAFSAIWRALDQKNFPVSWDLIGSYSPNLINAKAANANEDGTVARGGVQWSAGTAVSYETKSFTVYGEGLATYLGSRDVLNQTTGYDTGYDHSWQYQLALSTQTRLSDLWSVNLGATETFNNSDNTSYVNGSHTLINYTSAPGDDTTLNAAINFQVIPNRLVASVLYQHEFYGNTSYNYATLPHSDSTTKDEGSDLVGGLLRYTFN